MSRPKIVLDCDPGIDDAFAIFCALRHTDLVAVTSVAGNVGVEQTTRNALGVLELAGADVPVHRGASAALAGRVERAAHVHGESGLGGVTLPPPHAEPQPESAAEALIELTADGDVVVVAVGPLTNLALAIRLDDGFAARLPRLVLMGGSTGAGNVTAAAEFNICADPEAAAIVFSSGAPVTMAGLNLTQNVRMGRSEIDRLRSAGTPTASMAADALDYYASFSERTIGVASSAMHDPCAVLDVVRPDLFRRRAVNVVVETTGEHTRGMTLVDDRPDPAPANADALVDAEADSVVELIVEAATRPLAN